MGAERFRDCSHLMTSRDRLLIDDDDNDDDDDDGDDGDDGSGCSGVAAGDSAASIADAGWGRRRTENGQEVDRSASTSRP